MAEPDPIAALDALQRDREHGASEIATRARHQLARLADTDADPDRARRAVLGLAQTHAGMAALVHLADEALRALDEAGLAGLAELPRPRSPVEAIAEHAGPGIADAGLLATYSRSGTVQAALERACEAGPVRVQLSEARPGGEGLGLARELAAQGADVELTYDAQLATAIGEADLLLVGADAITADAFVNKAGTRPLLAHAQQAGTPTRVLAATTKLWPTEALGEPLVDAEADWHPDVPAQVDVHAPLFERVPLDLADRIVTEQGALEPEALGERIRDLDVHPDLAAAIGEARS
jgi:methylthioribose-1-phosphate isomerase